MLQEQFRNRMIYAKSQSQHLFLQLFLHSLLYLTQCFWYRIIRSLLQSNNIIFDSSRGMKMGLFLLFSISTLLYTTKCLISPPPAPQLCQNLYNNQTIPQQCSSSKMQCVFNQGLTPLLVNSSVDQNQYSYSLCLFLKQYSISITNDANITEIFKDYLSVCIVGQSITFGITNPPNNYNGQSSNKSIFSYTSYFSNNLIILSDTTITIQNSSISARLFWLQAQFLITVSNSNIVNQSSLESSCTCYLSESTCKDWTFKFPYLYNESGYFNLTQFNKYVQYSNINFNCITLMSYQAVSIENSQLKSSVIGLFTQTLSVQNSGISSDGLGYASDLGQGCGFFDQLLNQLLGCTGSGGSHGGWGGNSSPNNCNLMISKTPYGDQQYPYAPGSGGGFFFRQSKEVSSGGGIIHVQVLNIQLKGQVNFTSDGNGGMQSGGGGSGGVFALDYSSVSNNGSTAISAQGGNGKSSGGGGRIRYYNHLWQNTTEFPQNISVSVNGGSQCNSKLACGTAGSIFASPCMPGYQLDSVTFSCQPCPVGQYQITYGYSNCLKCYYKPQDSYYAPINSSSSYLQACNFNCDQGFSYKEGKCMTEFQSIMYNIGGVNVLICLGIIVVVVILYLVVIMVRRMTMKQAFWSSYQQLQKYSSKKYFQVQDIPYHQIRIYLSGKNQPFDPWQISQDYSQRIFQQSSILLNRISHLIKPIFKKINTKSVYSRWQKSILIFLKFYYYPLYCFTLDYIKASKANYIFKTINRLDQKIPQTENISIKFHVKPNITIGCIQIFDFTRSVYDYYIDNYLPIIFQLQRMPLADFTIDFTDPFLKALMSSLVQGEQKTKQLMTYFKQLNSLLRSCQQMLPILSHLWTITQIVPHVQAYLWQPPDCVIGIDNQFKIDKKRKLFLMITNDKQPRKKHFLSCNQLRNVHFNEIECLKHKFNLRKESTLSPQPKISFWEINHQVSEKLLTWLFGLASILVLLLCVTSLFVVIFILSEDKIKFYYGISIYFVLLPLSDFLQVFLNFKAVLVKSHKIISYAIYFTVGTIIKYGILCVCALIQMLVANTENSGNTLIDIIFGVWLAQFIFSWIILAIQMMLNPLFLKSS